jgi:hypothetical protein
MAGGTCFLMFSNSALFFLYSRALRVSSTIATRRATEPHTATGMAIAATLDDDDDDDILCTVRSSYLLYGKKMNRMPLHPNMTYLVRRFMFSLTMTLVITG